MLTSRLQTLIWFDDATAWNETYNPSLKVIGSQLRQSNLERTAWSDKAFKLYRALNCDNCVSRSIEYPYLVIDEKPKSAMNYSVNNLLLERSTWINFF